jgi:hypothetical protein
MNSPPPKNAQNPKPIGKGKLSINLDIIDSESDKEPFIQAKE